MLSKRLIVILLICSISACAETDPAAAPWRFDDSQDDAVHEVERINELPAHEVSSGETFEVPTSVASFRKLTRNVYVINQSILWSRDTGDIIATEISEPVAVDEPNDVVVYTAIENPYASLGNRRRNYYLAIDGETRVIGERGNDSLSRHPKALLIADRIELTSILVKSTTAGTTTEEISGVAIFLGDWIAIQEDTGLRLRHIDTAEERFFENMGIGGRVFDGRMVVPGQPDWLIIDPEAEEPIFYDPGGMKGRFPLTISASFDTPVRVSSDVYAFLTEGGRFTLWRGPDENIVIECGWRPTFVPSDRNHVILACGDNGAAGVFVVDIDRMEVLEAFRISASLMRGHSKTGEPGFGRSEQLRYATSPSFAGVRADDEVPFYWSPETGLLELEGEFDTASSLGPNFIRSSANGRYIAFCEHSESGVRWVERDLWLEEQRAIELERECAFHASEDLSNGILVSGRDLLPWSEDGSSRIATDSSSELRLGSHDGDIAFVESEDSTWLYDLSDRSLMQFEKPESPTTHYSREAEPPRAWIHGGIIEGRETNLFGWREDGLSSATNLGPGDWRVFETKGEVWLVQNKDGEAELKKVAL